jgi:hypothetical protein
MIFSLLVWFIIKRRLPFLIQRLSHISQEFLFLKKRILIVSPLSFLTPLLPSATALEK